MWPANSLFSHQMLWELWDTWRDACLPLPSHRHTHTGLNNAGGVTLKVNGGRSGVKRRLVYSERSEWGAADWSGLGESYLDLYKLLRPDLYTMGLPLCGPESPVLLWFTMQLAEGQGDHSPNTCFKHCSCCRIFSHPRGKNTIPGDNVDCGFKSLVRQ